MNISGFAAITLKLNYFSVNAIGIFPNIPKIRNAFPST
jgi:hypothetical protein